MKASVLGALFGLSKIPVCSNPHPGFLLREVDPLAVSLSSIFCVDHRLSLAHSIKILD